MSDAVTGVAVGQTLPESFRRFVLEFSDGAYLFGAQEVSSVGAAKHPKGQITPLIDCFTRIPSHSANPPLGQFPDVRRGRSRFTICSIVGGAGFSRASEIAWEEYYRAIEGRSLRPLFVDAIRFLPTQRADDHALVAIDLGCETAARRLRSWRAAGRSPPLTERLRRSRAFVRPSRPNTVRG